LENAKVGYGDVFSANGFLSEVRLLKCYMACYQL